MTSETPHKSRNSPYKDTTSTVKTIMRKQSMINLKYSSLAKQTSNQCISPLRIAYARVNRSKRKSILETEDKFTKFFKTRQSSDFELTGCYPLVDSFLTIEKLIQHRKVCDFLDFSVNS